MQRTITQTTGASPHVSYEDALVLFLDTDPSYADGLSNHGPMAVEALVHLGVAHWIGPFVDQYQGRLDAVRRHVAPAPVDWRDWLRPALEPLVATAANLAGHGLLRVAHAVRGIERAEADGSVSELHRRELATAVEYWRDGGPGLAGPDALTGSQSPDEWARTLGRLRPDERSDGLLTKTLATAAATPDFATRVAALAPADDPTTNFDALGAMAADSFACNQGLSAFTLLHGTTVSNMASVLVPFLDTAGRRRLEAAVTGFVAAAIIGFDESDGARPTGEMPSVSELADAAAASKEDHTIKFVDACISIAARSGDPAILRAAHRQVVDPYGGS